MKKVLYIGGFELPDKNAAAQRVHTIALMMRDNGYDVHFVGLSKNGNESGTVDGFEYISLSYPQGLKAWLLYAIGKDVKSIFRRYSPDVVIAYNYPAVASFRLIRYCHKKRINIVGDITEWYSSDRLVKKIDVFLRMRLVNKLLDGIIVISRYLKEYYKKKLTIELPPLVDLSNPKWQYKGDEVNRQDLIRLIYSGSPGIGANNKDRLDVVISSFLSIHSPILSLVIIGLSQQEFEECYNLRIPENSNLTFLGRVPHQKAIEELMTSDFQIIIRDSNKPNNAGFPTKLVESISAGIPVIATPVSNIEDYIKDGYNAIIIPSPQEADIKGALERISQMNRVSVIQLKKQCDRNLFDYRRFLPLMKGFISSLNVNI